MEALLSGMVRDPFVDGIHAGWEARQEADRMLDDRLRDQERLDMVQQRAQDLAEYQAREEMEREFRYQEHQRDQQYQIEEALRRQDAEQEALRMASRAASAAEEQAFRHGLSYDEARHAADAEFCVTYNAFKPKW